MVEVGACCWAVEAAVCCCCCLAVEPAFWPRPGAGGDGRRHRTTGSCEPWALGAHKYVSIDISHLGKILAVTSSEREKLKLNFLKQKDF